MLFFLLFKTPNVTVELEPDPRPKLLHLHAALFIQPLFTDEDRKIFSVPAVVGPAEATLLQLEIAEVWNFFITLLTLVFVRVSLLN